MLVVSLVLSLVILVLLFGVTWYFQSSLDLLQQQVEYRQGTVVEVTGTSQCEANGKLYVVYNFAVFFISNMGSTLSMILYFSKINLS